MTKTAQQKLFPFNKAENPADEIPAVVELSDEETDLVAGGPEVQNDPPDH